MVLDEGHIAEFDKYVFFHKAGLLVLTQGALSRPSVLLSNPASKFYALCKVTGKEEFAMLKKMAGVY